MSDKNELAEDRTDWAEDRTLMANERTFASWVGTGLGAIGVALGMKAVFGDFDPTWAAKLVATIFLLAAVFLFWSARQKAKKACERLSEHDVKSPQAKVYTFLATLMSVGAVGTGVVLWSL